MPVRTTAACSVSLLTDTAERICQRAKPLARTECDTQEPAKAQVAVALSGRMTVLDRCRYCVCKRGWKSRKFQGASCKQRARRWVSTDFEREFFLAKTTLPGSNNIDRLPNTVLLLVTTHMSYVTTKQESEQWPARSPEKVQGTDGQAGIQVLFEELPVDLSDSSDGDEVCYTSDSEGRNGD